MDDSGIDSTLQVCADKPRESNVIRRQRRKKRAKLPKDPDHPRRPISSYLRWAKDNRLRVKEEVGGGDVPMKIVSRELGKQWNQSKEETKNKYRRDYEDARNRFMQEKEQYQPSLEFKQTLRAARNARKKAKNPALPTVTEKKRKMSERRMSYNKRPRSAFALWKKDKRALVKQEMTSPTRKEIAAELERRWSLQPKNIHDEYKGQAARELEEYEAEWGRRARYSMDGPNDTGAADGRGARTAYELYTTEQHTNLSRKWNKRSRNKKPDFKSFCMQQWLILHADDRMRYEEISMQEHLGLHQPELTIQLEPEVVDEGDAGDTCEEPALQTADSQYLDLLIDTHTGLMLN